MTEPVFDADDRSDWNLASMMIAQVALNYGLFCREIVFHGPFDPVDRAFLREMAANTAREIYVKKFLEPNPFLLPEVSGMPAEKRDSYLQARMVFPDDECRGFTGWDTSRAVHAILSSGGKESLLSYGLLSELGVETHPVFVNESGRHWFTALNAYRHFSREVENTARVWTNCDRVFAWMLRRLRFIRPDFDSVRSDEYPIRLWTVAVFLFGALATLLWLLFAYSMAPPPYLSSYLLKVGEMEETRARELRSELLALKGVGDAFVVADEGVAYLKVDSKVVDRSALDAFSVVAR